MKKTVGWKSFLYLCLVFICFSGAIVLVACENNATSSTRIQKSGISKNILSGWTTFEVPHKLAVIDFSFVKPDEGWAVGERGLILFYNGQTWTPVDSPAGDRHLFSVDFTSSYNGWAVGQSGMILHFDGKAWKALACPTNFELMSVSSLNPLGAWATGDRNKFYHYDGNAWKLGQLPPKVCYLTQVCFLNASDGWAIGNDGVIFFWDGTRWNDFPSPTKEALHGIFFLEPGNGWIVGENGTILNYNGAEWKPVESAINNHLFAISFSGPEEGIIGGSGGTLLKLKYEAGRWKINRLISPTEKTIHTVFSPSPGIYWIGGRAGKLALFKS